MDAALMARAQALEKDHYKLRVSSRGILIHWQHYQLCNIELYDDEGPRGDTEHLKLAADNFQKAVEFCEHHQRGRRTKSRS